MIHRHAGFTAVFCAAAASFLIAVPAHPQQPPAPQAGRGGRGFGGFTQPDPIDFEDHAGWKSMFDGQTLNGWDGNKEIWHVENGAIVAESTCEDPTGTTYLIWQGGQPGDFELKAELRGEGPGINSGIQYRSFIQEPRQGRGGPGGRAGFGGRGPAGPCPSGKPRGTPNVAANAKWNLGGPQADFDGTNRYSGQYYEGGTSRGIVAWRGQVVRAEEGKHPRLLAMLGDPEALGGYVKIDNWNQIHIIAHGDEMIHIINGHVMAIFLDDDPTKFRKNGYIGLQIEGMGKVSFRNLWIRTE
jgi:3-keto-disaccharide hydrolase